MGMTFEKLLPQLEFTPGVQAAICQETGRDEGAVRTLAKQAYQGDGFDFPLCKSTPLTRLTVVTYLLVEKYGAYAAKGISDSIILDTFRDVSLRARLYWEQNGEAGLSADDVIWFRHIMNVGIFKVGTLQFQPFEMLYLDEETIGEPYMTFTQEQKSSLPAGTPVINCHIQQGADLSGSAVSWSLRESKLFFARHLPASEFKAFLCYSWLLYPPMVQQLPESSHIRRFAERFTIVGQCRDSAQAIENLFSSGQKPPSAATSLQKIAAAHPELLGFACGIIML